MFSIAIDGPVSSGKSTVARIIAERLNILHLNTGALYRAIGLYAYRNNIASFVDENGVAHLNERDMERLINEVDIDVKFIDGKQHTFLNGEDVSDKLHNPLISDYSSRVSVIKKVRDHILHLQRSIAANQSVVMEGRDITSHVLPDSKYKFYLTASAEIRAKRRYEEEVAKGNKDLTYEEVLNEVKIRDFRDMTRDICPLVIVPDAIVVDTDNLPDPQLVAEELLKHIKE